MDADVYEMYKERVREEMSVGEYDNAIIEFYLHGDSVVERYLNDVTAERKMKEIFALR